MQIVVELIQLILPANTILLFFVELCVIDVFFVLGFFEYWFPHSWFLFSSKFFPFLLECELNELGYVNSMFVLEVIDNFSIFFRDPNIELHTLIFHISIIL
jgi:hypothetical protein